MENFPANTQVHEYSLKGIVYFLAFLISLASFSQPPLSTANKKAQKLYFKAEKEYKERDFQAAIAFLDQATGLDGTFYEAFLRKGSLFNALGEEDSVFANFSRYAALTPLPSASVLERLAHMAFDRGKYLEAQAFLNDFLEMVPEKASDRVIALLNQSISFAIAQVGNPISIEIKILPSAINQFKLQYLPAMTVDENTMVYTKRDQFSDDEDIVVSFREEGVWQKSTSISTQINTAFNEGAATISADGRTMIFTACDRKGSYGSCDLYLTRKSGENWSRPKNLGSVVNSKYWESQPSLSSDGKTLYFASNRPGGYGGRDLWVTNQEDDEWSQPQNLGPLVNSFKDETTPFVHFNGQTLYFSSNSYPGLGGFDLFQIDWQDSIWSSPTNLGYPLNTFRDEVALLVSADGSRGYYALEQQKNREILDSKIVNFVLPEHLQPLQSYYLSGKVLDKSSGLPLEAQLQIVDIKTNKILYENTSDAVTGKYYLVLPAGKELAGYVKKKGFLYHDFNFSTTIKNDINVDTLDLWLNPIAEGKSLVLRNIYFETNSADLDGRSQSEISNVIELLNENPEIKIEIGGHTDDIGDKRYNQTLSEKRAVAVVDALIQSGIDSDRLAYLGYGDSQPIVPNDSESNRQSNRRIEFRVIRSKQ